MYSSFSAMIRGRLERGLEMRRGTEAYDSGQAMEELGVREEQKPMIRDRLQRDKG